MKKFLVWSGWILLVAVLGGNLVMAYVRQPKGDDTPQGFITPELLQTGAFWAPMAATFLMSLLGLYWSSRAYSQTERTSLLWARRGYALSLLGGAVLVMAVFDAELFPRPWLAAVSAVLLALQTSIFAMVSFKELRRAETGEGSRRPRGHRER